MESGRIVRIIVPVVLCVVLVAGGLAAFFQSDRGETSDKYALSNSFTAAELQAFEAEFAAVQESEVAWLKTCVLPDGALAFRPVREGENSVNQYFSIYAALALLAADPGEAECAIVRAHLVWSFRHMHVAEPDGEGLLYTVENYTETLSDGYVVSEVATGYDAADSELALLLSEVGTYVELSGDYALLDEYSQEIKGSIDTLFSLFEDDGLAYGKPSYWVGYLMDNCEVYQGLTDASTLFSSYYLKDSATQRDRQMARALKEKLVAMEEGFESVLWDEQGGHYLAYAGQKGFDWDVFYADANAQLFPVIFGVIESDSVRAVELYDAFCAHYKWESMDYYTSGQSAFYWSVLALGAAHMGDLERLNAYLTAYTALTKDGHAYPAYSGDTAMVVLACAQARQLCAEALGGS